MKKLIICAICAAMAVSGCTGITKNDSENISGAQIGKADKMNKNEDKDLNLSMRSALTLNPLLNEDESVDTILRLMFEPLIGIDEKYKPKQAIAESWYYSEEGTTLTLKLKQGLKWHDGNEITADDVVFSVKTLQGATENAVYKQCVANIFSATKADEYTVVIKFKTSSCGNLYALSFPVIPFSYYGNSGIGEEDKKFKPMGSGVYKFESYTAAKEIVLKATENSFGVKPQIETVVVNITNDADTDVFSFSQRLTDCVVADETILGKVDLNKNANKYSFTDNYYDFIGFNFDNEILKQKSIRKAIAYAVPLESIIEGVYLSDAVEAKSPLNPDSWLNNMESSKYSFDLDKAKEYVGLSGFNYNGESRVREKTTDEGKMKLEFTMLVNKENLQRCQAAVKIAEELNGIGFNVSVERVGYEEYASRLESGSFDMFLGGWELSITPEFGFMFESGSDKNYINYSSERMDSLISAYRNSISESTMQAAMNDLTKEIDEELPYVSLVFRRSALFTDKIIGGAIKPLQFDALNGVENWQIK